MVPSDVELRYRTLARALPDAGVLVVDAAGRIELAEGTVLERLGLPPVGVEGRDAAELLAARGLADLLEHIEAALGGGERHVDSRAPDGRRYHTRVLPVRDHRGAVTGAMAVTVDLTEHLALESELAHAQAIGRVGSWRWDLIADVVTWSAEFARTWGVSAADEPATAATLLDRMHPEDRRPLLDAVEDLRATGTPIDVTVRVLAPLGERAVRLRGEVADGRDGALVLRGTAQDVTEEEARHEERQRAQQALAEAHARLSEAQEVANIGSWEADLVTGEVDWSPQLRRIYGEPSLTPHFDLADYTSRLPEGDAEAFAEAMNRLREDGVAFTAEHTYRRDDGTSVTVHVNARAERDADGRVVRLAGTTQDVSAVRAAQAARRRAEERFAAAFDLAPIGMALCDLEGRYVRVNRALAALTGHAPTELEGREMGSLVHAEDREEHAAAFAELLAGEEPPSREHRIVHAEGHPVWVAIHGRLLPATEEAPDRVLVQYQDVTERRRFEDRLQHLADHDPLTGLLNRRAFASELERHLAQVQRYGATGAVLVLDLDHFKVINDTHGHGAGDDLIGAVAACLRTRLRTTDVLARLGGDEFAVLLPRAGGLEAERVAGALLEAIGEVETLVGGRARHVTASVGIAVVATSDVTGDELLVCADLAMYDAKEGGRNRFARYRTEEGAQPAIKARLTWLERIERAIEGESFVLYAQPILDLRLDKAIQWELLLRLRTDEGELVPPGSFLHVAERFDLIQTIDRWVAGQAVHILATDPDEDLELNVNLSAKTLADAEFLPALERRLSEVTVDPGRLCLELTETAAVVNVGRARAFVDRVHALGCRFALDDFGAGFGSFAYLKHLPFDLLKIDGEFVRGVARRQADRLVIDAVVSIAHGLGRTTVAECAEDEPTISYLRERGVDFAQGFAIGVPVPAATVLGAGP